MVNRIVFIAVFILLKISLIHGQCPTGGAIFINEIYNEAGNAKEYIELVVVGDPANPMADVDLEGWIIDDNNKDETDQGTATGHLILDNTFSAVKPGAIILIYNELDEYSPIPGNSPPYLYVVHGSDLNGCSSIPNTTNSSYIPCTPSGGEYKFVGMKNGGDLIQTRPDESSAYHALRYPGYPNFIAAEVSPVDVSDKTIGLDCGDWFDGSNYTITTQTPGDFNSPDNQLLIMAIRNGNLDCNNIALSCNPICPEINGIEIITSPVCDYEDFIVRATDLAYMGGSANGDKDFGIDFVYFSGASAPTDAYSGGTFLDNVPYSSLTGTDPNQIAEITVAGGTLAAGTYNICAILDDVSTNGCDPQQCEVIIINESPIASLDGTSEFCPGDCHQINTTITGGVEPYKASFTITVGLFNYSFDVDAYDTDNELTICYTNPPSVPDYYDSGTNTLYVPSDFLGEPLTGSGTITMTDLVDDNGCAAQNIDPDFMTLIFKEDLEIPSAEPLEECDYDFDGEAEFDLTSLDGDLTSGDGGLTVNWYQDSDCTSDVPDPTSFTTSTTTVYVYLSDDSGDKCNSDTIPVDLIVIDIPNPGDDTQIDICNTEGCVDFDFEMGSDYESGGDWVDMDGAGVDLNYTNCVEFEDVNTGTYRFSYTTHDDNNKCEPVSAILTVNVAEPGDPGKDNSDTFCGAPTNDIDLDSYLSDPHDNGGVWEDESGNIIPDPNNLDMSSETVGTYEYYYIIDNAPCNPESAIITIEIIGQPNAGDDNEIYICNSGSSTVADFDNALGTHDSNGDWTDIDNAQVDLTNDNYVDFSGVDADTFQFQYLIPNNGNCSEDFATITVYVQAAPYAGIGGASSICVGSTDTINLYDFLGQNYDKTGVWSYFGTTTTIVTRPDTLILSAEPIGIDSFLYETTGNCGTDSAFVYIDIVSSPNAGDDYNYIICLGSSINLFDSLENYSIGGKWLDSNLDTINNFSNLTLDELKEYSFLYVLEENGTCLGDTALVKISTIAAPEAGVGSDFTVCQGSTEEFNLFDYLSGNSQNDGQWLNSTNTVINNPTKTSFKDFTLGDHKLKYLLPSNGYCLGDSAEVIVSVILAPVAGNDNFIEVCNNDINNIINLEDQLGIHDTGGQWIDINNANVSLNDISNVNFKDVSSGTYKFKYLLNSNSVCPSDSAVISVTVKQKIFAGTDSELTFCEGGSDLVNILNELKPDHNTEYVIEDIGSTGALRDSIIEISKLNKGTYKFSLKTGQQDLCGEDKSVLTINIVEKLNAGNDNDMEVCNDDSLYDLSNLLGTFDEGGNWSDIDNLGVDVQGSKGKDVSFKDKPAGVYRFEYKIEGSSSCPESKAIITVKVKSTTRSSITEELCPGQDFVFEGNTYNLDNPTGEVVITNTQDCDSIITITITEKSISSDTYFENENCNGVGKFILKDMQDMTFPITLNIKDIGEFEVNTFPFEVNNLPNGNYVYSITDSKGCMSNVDDNFTIKEFVDYLINTKVSTLDNSYSINVETNISPETIVWTPSDYLSCDNCLNPTATPETDQEYIVVITDSEGCIVSDTIYLNAIEKEIEIDIPNVFTPDGDGKNDYFYVSSEALDLTYTMYIFDRWGEKLFYGENLKFNDATSGWDGDFNGRKANPGVYVYMIIINYKSDKKDIRPGDMLLLR